MHIDANQGTIRFYAKGKCFENHDEFECSMMFMVLSPTVVYIYAAVGRMGKDRYEEMAVGLIERGFTKVLAYLPTRYKPKIFKQLVGTDLHVANV